MSGRRLGSRFSAALVVTAMPVALAGISAQAVPSAHAAVPRASASALVSVAPFAPTVSVLQRHYPGSMSAPAQAMAPQTTISGDLALGTRAERNRRIAVSSAKGNLVWTASSLAEHGLPSAALRAYKHAAATVNASDPGCALPWTLLAGIGRVESDHGRYAGSVLGNDGVPRPAIVGIALNGVGPVAAIADTDGGVFDGDTVWDRAVGPMQFIPSTWSGAGRDGDGDGRSTPNDIDDAALAAAAYLCNGGGNLSDESSRRLAIFRYNPSDYYVALVSAFERGYRTGVFAIPSPAPPPGAGDGVVHRVAKAEHAKAKHAKAKHAKAAAKKRRAHAAAARKPTRRPAAHPTRHPTAAPVRPSPTPGATSPRPRPPKPKPTKPPPPRPVSTSGLISGGPGGLWAVNGHSFQNSGFSAVAPADYDADGTKETLPAELAGLVARAANVTLTYQARTSPLRVTKLVVNALAPLPSAAPSTAAPTAQ